MHHYGEAATSDRPPTTPQHHALCSHGSTYGSVCGLEAIELGLGAALVLVLRDLGLQDLLGDLPELGRMSAKVYSNTTVITTDLLMLGVEQEYNTGRLRVEAGGDVEHDLVDELGNLLVTLGRLLVELVDGTALLDGVEESLGGGHGS